MFSNNAAWEESSASHITTTSLMKRHYKDQIQNTYRELWMNIECGLLAISDIHLKADIQKMYYVGYLLEDRENELLQMIKTTGKYFSCPMCSAWWWWWWIIPYRKPWLATLGLLALPESSTVFPSPCVMMPCVGPGPVPASTLHTWTQLVFFSPLLKWYPFIYTQYCLLSNCLVDRI